MQSILTTNQTSKLFHSHIILTVFAMICLAAITIFGVKGLLLSLVVAVGSVIVPYLYNKPEYFLFFSLFIYPFTRLLPLDNKFILTGCLYTLAMPCAIWLFFKTFSSISKNLKFLVPMMLYSGLVLLSMFNVNSSMIEVLKEFGRTFYAIFIILALCNYLQENKHKIFDFCKYISYMLNTIALIAVFQYITKTGGFVVEGVFRARGTFFNFNEYGYIISIFIAFALFMLLQAKEKKERIYWVGTIGLNLIALLATMSKTSLVNTALVFGIIAFALPWKRKIQFIGISAILAPILLLYFRHTGMLNTIIQRFSDNTSLFWRFEIWGMLQNMISQGNFLLGEGANASREFLQLVVPLGESFAPHNIYLETIYNYGIISFIPFILVFLLVFLKGIQILKSDLPNKIAGISIIAVITVTLIQNFVSNAFYDRSVNVIFWGILALLIVAADANFKVDNQQSNYTI
ncbi:MAG: O-antigen ligase family protein [Candidatus Gastranaerophilales bacterium]|nr:O-antigen ligase family protein [Candidatus Gastranaerophilales bacterium]